MNISLENIDKVSAVLTIKMEKADYAERVEKALKDYRRKASLPGFRPGQVPMALLKKRFGKEITAEEVNKLLGEKLYAYIKDNKLNILGEPLPSEGRQQNIDFDTMEEFSFAFDIALAPEFKAELGAEDTVDYYDIQVDDKMVDNQVKMFAQRGGSYETVDSYEPKDMVKGLLAELDENGNTKEGGIQVENAVLLLVFPVYCERVPPPVAAYLKTCGAERAAFVACYGGMSYGRALYDAKALFRGAAVAAAYVPAGHAYMKDGYPFDEAALAPLFEKVRSGESSPAVIPKGKRHLLSGAPALRSRLGVKLVRSSRCSGCGVCERACPMHAIRAGKPDSRCIRCLRCVRVCPERALSFRLSPLLKAYP